MFISTVKYRIEISTRHKKARSAEGKLSVKIEGKRKKDYTGMEIKEYQKTAIHPLTKTTEKMQKYDMPLCCLWQITYTEFNYIKLKYLTKLEMKIVELYCRNILLLLNSTTLAHFSPDVSIPYFNLYIFLFYKFFRSYR